MRSRHPLALAVWLAPLWTGSCTTPEPEAKLVTDAAVAADTTGQSLKEPGALATAATAPVTKWAGDRKSVV